MVGRSPGATRELVRIEKYVDSKDALAYWSDGEVEDVTYNFPDQAPGQWTADVLKGPPGSRKPQLHHGVQVIVKSTPEQRIAKLPGYIQDHLRTVGGDPEWLAQYGEELAKQGVTQADLADSAIQVSGKAPADPDFELVSAAQKAGYSKFPTIAEFEKNLQRKVRGAKDDARTSGINPPDPLEAQEWRDDPAAAEKKWKEYVASQYTEAVKTEAAQLRELDRRAKVAMGAVNEILIFEAAGVGAAVTPALAGAADAAAIRLMASAPRLALWAATHPHLLMGAVGGATGLATEYYETGTITPQGVAYAGLSAMEGDYADITQPTLPPGSLAMTPGEEPAPLPSPAVRPMSAAGETEAPAPSLGQTPAAVETVVEPAGEVPGAPAGEKAAPNAAPPGGGGPRITRLPPGPEPEPEPMHIKDEDLPEGTHEIRRTPNIETISLTDEEMLAANMAAKGRPVEPGHAAHHIALKKGGGYYGQLAREHLRRLGVGINDAENGIALPTYRQRGQVPEPEGGAYHGSIHTKVYNRAIARRILQARDADEARRILTQIAEEIKNGVFPN